MIDYADMVMAAKIIQSFQDAHELRQLGIEPCAPPLVTYNPDGDIEDDDEGK